MPRLFIISGGSKGLGAALTRQAVEQGDTVVSLSRSAPPAGGFLAVDFNDPQAVWNAVQQATREFGRGASGYVLINNAGVLEPISASPSVAEITQSLNVNFVSQVSATRAFLDVLGTSTGRRQIVNISSGAAVKTYHGWSLYSSAKAGLEHFARVVATEQKAATIPAELVNISPGVMDTHMQTLIRSQTADEFPNVGQFKDMHARGELSDPKTVASHILRGIDSAHVYAGETVGFQEFGQS